MSWRYVVALVVFVALVGSAAVLLGHEPAGAEGPYRQREICSCRVVTK